MPARWPDLHSAALLPALWWQGRRLRQRLPTLQVPTDASQGLVPGVGDPWTLLAIGESPVACYGLPSHGDGLAAHLARRLHTHTGRPVHWHTHGHVGATLSDLLTRADGFPGVQPDLVFVGMGVNDTKRFVRRARWVSDWRGLHRTLRARYGSSPVLVSDIPPLGAFPALTPLLAHALGRRATLLQEALDAWVADTPGVRRAPLDIPQQPQLFCADGFHPSARGQRAWADSTWPAAAEALGLSVDAPRPSAAVST
jgi:lysophospholipase L1-like esterase